MTQRSFGRSGWLVLVASSVCMLTVWVAYVTFSVFFPVMEQEFGWSRTDISGAVSLGFIVSGVVGLIVGGIADKYGPRVLLIGCLFVGLATILSSWLNSLWQWYIFITLGLGVGMGGFYPVLTATVSRWFPTKRGLALGILLTNLGLAYLVGPLIAAAALGALGWRSAYLVIGVLVLVVASSATVFLHNPLSGAGTPDAPFTFKGKDRYSSLRSPISRDMIGVSLKEALGIGTFWMIGITWFFLGFAQTMITVHLVALGNDKGISFSAAAGALSSLGVGSVVGRVGIGWLSDRMGNLVSFRICGALQVIGIVTMLATAEYSALYLAAGVFGLASSGADTVTSKAAPEALGTRSLAAILSALNLVRNIGASLGPAWAGLMFDNTGSYWIPFGTSAVGLVATAFLFGVVTRARGYGLRAVELPVE